MVSRRRHLGVGARLPTVNNRTPGTPRSLFGECAAGCSSLVPSAIGQMPFRIGVVIVVDGRVSRDYLWAPVVRQRLSIFTLINPDHPRIVVLGYEQLAVVRSSV